MSRNPPEHGITKPSKFKGFRAKQPKYGPPIEAHGACRRALNEAVLDRDYGKADRIADKDRRADYSRLSKPELIDFLKKA